MDLVLPTIKVSLMSVTALAMQQETNLNFKKRQASRGGAETFVYEKQHDLGGRGLKCY